MEYVYAVRKGRTPGLYHDIEMYRRQVDGFPGAEGKRFTDEDEAMRYLDGELMSKKGIYAVRQGRVPGIYYSAEECEQQVKGFTGAESRRFSDIQRAQAYLSARPAKHPAKRPPLKVARVVHSQRGPNTAGHPGACSALTQVSPPGNPDEAIRIYTDGGCLVHEDGAGGYAAVICLPNGNRKEISGGVDTTRSERMELLAAVSALRTLPALAALGASVQVYTDSQYLYNGAAKAIWRDWTKEQADAFLHHDLWLELAELCPKYKIAWYWVKGHNGDSLNERCDWLATAAAKRTVAEKRWVPDFAGQLEAAKNRIKDLERDNKKLAEAASRYQLLAGERVASVDKDLFRAVNDGSLVGFLKWKVRHWRHQNR
jgi:ribonuclease HI